MKKGLIISLYDNNNYGNRLQNYAVYKILNEYNFYLINVKNNECFNYYDKDILRSKLGFIKSRFFYYDFMFKKFGVRCYLKRERNFKKFSSKIPTTRRYFKYDLMDKYNSYDYLFVGSDQVWNPFFCRNKEISDLMLLKDFKGKKIAFSASFGQSNISEKEKDRIKPYLNQFSAISVREEQGKKICDELLTGEKESVVLLDPTMLLKVDEWLKVLKKPSFEMPKKYILMAFLGNIKEDYYNSILECAKSNKYEIVNLFEKNSKYASCGPAEFLYLEKHASLICTDSFHSSVFAILFNVPFVVFDRCDNIPNMNSRIETLISKFDLKNRKYNGAGITEGNINADYSEVKKILEVEKRKADEFLKSAIEN